VAAIAIAAAPETIAAIAAMTKRSRRVETLRRVLITEKGYAAYLKEI
jgi:hypothetical protein